MKILYYDDRKSLWCIFITNYVHSSVWWNVISWLYFAILILSWMVGWFGGWVGGRVGSIKIKDHLSPVEIEIWAELGNKSCLCLVKLLQQQLWNLKLLQFGISIFSSILTNFEVKIFPIDNISSCRIWQKVSGPCKVDQIWRLKADKFAIWVIKSKNLTCLLILLHPLDVGLVCSGLAGYAINGGIQAAAAQNIAKLIPSFSFS